MKWVNQLLFLSMRPVCVYMYTCIRTHFTLTKFGIAGYILELFFDLLLYV